MLLEAKLKEDLTKGIINNKTQPKNVTFGGDFNKT